MSAPILTVIAGANGCGKSTLTKWARAFFQQTATLDPDAVAVDLQAQTAGVLSPIEVGTDALSINIVRVQARVLKGGHDVPPEDQTRRYDRSFKNLPKALDLADEGVLLDNSTDAGHRVVALKLDGRNMLFFDPLPVWAEFLRS